MRVLGSVLLAAGVLMMGQAVDARTRHSSHVKVAPALTGLPCLYDRDRAAFDIEGLKSQMMVTAETCKGQAQDNYSEFVTRYRPAIASAEDVLHAYFNHAYGKAGSKQYDEYMTQLADNQEQVGLKAGTAYCDNLSSMFDEVMSLHDASELHDYSNSKMLYQPVSFDTCSGAPPALPSSHKSRHGSRSTKHT